MKLMFMKLFFSLFLVLFLSTKVLVAENYNEAYSIKTKGLSIGLLDWSLEILDNKYKIRIYIKNKGVLSGLYKFSGLYESEGTISNSSFLALKYKQSWETKKKKRVVEINFKNKRVTNLKIIPEEKELARIDYKKIYGYSDPLTSFVNILINNKPSKTIDGRRSYLLFPKSTGDFKKILIKEFTNIWADHKRNDLEFIETYQDKDSVLPKQIRIGFKGSIFSLKKL